MQPCRRRSPGRELDYNLLLTRYALERLLYRLSISDQRDQFLLKGAINDAQKEKQWQAFLRKNALGPMSLAAVINDLREFLLPVLTTATTSNSYNMAWRAGERWR